MAQSYSIVIATLGFLFQFLFVNCQNPLVPALYVLGDSIVDSGNNDFLKTQAKADYEPYGVDFPSGATGRFTNGKTCVDFIAEFLGLPFAPPYLGLSESDKSTTTTGINYASGAAGILPETGTALGAILSLDEQIKDFEGTITKYLSKNFKSPVELSHHLAKSIFVISAGSNDYINNYLQPEKYNSSKIYNPEQFAMLLIDGLRKSLTKLHELGARKVVVLGLGPVGCLPAVINNEIPKPFTRCVETVNNNVVIFNTKLGVLLTQLTVNLPLSTFVLADIYGISYGMIKSPLLFGFTTSLLPCCVGNGTSLCFQNQAPCPDRNKNFFYDSFHASEKVYKALAVGCFTTPLPCVPINIKFLALKP